MKKFTYFLIILIAFSLNLTAVSAQNRANTSVDLTQNFVVDNNIGIQPIKIPIFSSFADFDIKNASILSWFSFAGALATVGLVIFWVFLIVRAGITALGSQGKPEGLEEAFKKIKSVFVGAAVSLFFPFVLSIIGVFFGIGTIFNWPKMFQFCTNEETYQFYYQAYLAGEPGSCNAAGT